MAYTGTKRRKAINLVREQLKARLKFREVKLEIPRTAPGLLEGQMAAYIGNAAETLTGFTNGEMDSDFRLAVLVFVRAESDIELAKVDAADAVEEALMALQLDSRFTNDAGLTQIQVVTIDRGPLALQVYGIDGDIAPPFGVVRLDVQITFAYTVF